MQKAFFRAWFASAATIVSCTFFGVIGLFPNLFPSSIKAEYSLTAFNASSSPLTLKIMLIVVLIFIPAVLAYQVWAYRLFSVKVTDEDLAHEDMY
jgi:cytochrome d ubiquinol oxidase subunit II